MFYGNSIGCCIRGVTVSHTCVYDVFFMSSLVSCAERETDE